MEGRPRFSSRLYHCDEAVRIMSPYCSRMYSLRRSRFDLSNGRLIRNFPSWSRRQGKDLDLLIVVIHSWLYSFPPGVLNTVPSLGSVGGAALTAHPDVDKVAFTGSTITGRKVMEAAAKSNLKKVSCPFAFLPLCVTTKRGFLQVSLELGGKSPNLVFESADLEQGQDCSSAISLRFSSIFCKLLCPSLVTYQNYGVPDLSHDGSWLGGAR